MGLQNQQTTFIHNFWFVDPQQPSLPKAARSQSMREVFRRRKWSRTRRNQGPRGIVAAGALKWTKNTGPPCEPPLQDDEFPVRETTRQGRRNNTQLLSPQCILGGQKHDPFHGFLVPSATREPSRALLIDFMLHGTASDLCGVHPSRAKFLLSKELFLVPSLQDPAPFNSLCAVASWAWDRVHGGSTSVEALRHKQEAIRLINYRIRGNAKISDQTILAVALLWKLEARLDDADYLETHVAGLMQMISLRGGLGSLNKRLQLVLGWFASSQPGKFALPFYNPLEVEDILVSPAVYFDLCSNELIGILQSVCCPKTLCGEQSRRTHGEFFNSSKTLHRLLSPSADLQQGPFRGRPLLKSLCRLASLLWLHSLILDCNCVFSSMTSQIDHLHDRLSEHGLSYQGTVVMLWHVLLKKEGAIAMDDRAWPVVRMMSVAKRMNIELVDELADLLWVRLDRQDGHHNATELIRRVREVIKVGQ